jgi:uncharacterized protein YmfQ (DUF2313 family)
MSSFNTMRQVLFFVWNMLDDDIKSSVESIADLFDSIETDFTQLLNEVDIYQATATGLLPDYERCYSVIPNSGDSDAVRRDRVIAALRSRGEYKKSKFERIARGLGYSIGYTGTKHIVIVDDQFKPFRAGISKAGDRVYSQLSGTSMYTVLVIGTAVESDSVLRSLFNKIKCAGIEIVFTNS